MAQQFSRVHHCDRVIIFAGLTFIALVLAAILYKFGPSVRSWSGQVEIISLWLFGFLLFFLAKFIEVRNPHQAHPKAQKCCGIGYVLMASAAFLEFVAA